MAGVLHDLRCLACDRTYPNVVVAPPDFGLCACGGERTWIPAGFYTDVHEPRYCEATGQYHSSHREAERVLGDQAKRWSDRTGMRWQPTASGDAVGGARPDHRLKDSAVSFGGQRIRRSSGERAIERRRERREARREQRPGDYSFHGVRGRRMSREEAAAYRKSQTHGEVATT